VVINSWQTSCESYYYFYTIDAEIIDEDIDQKAVRMIFGLLRQLYYDKSLGIYEMKQEHLSYYAFSSGRTCFGLLF
jgi:hypothetical protein